MRLLQPIRCSAIAGEEACWLVTLVDERWAWQRVRQAGDFSALTFPSATLTELQLNPSSTVTIPTSAVDSGACGCGSALANSGCDADLSGVTFDLRDSPAVPYGGTGAGSAADMILAHQGKVLVRAWNGTFTAVKLSTANADALANHDANSLHTFMGGRVFTAGSCIIPPEAYEILPRKFIYRTGTASYENGVASTPSGVLDTYGKRFARHSIEFGIEDLFNTPYSTIGAVEAAKLYHTATMTDTILWLTAGSADPADVDDVADNNELVRDVALTSAANYCEALLSPVDASYRGVAGWTPDGAADLLFDLNGPAPTTRAMRRPSWYARQEFYRKLAEIEVDAGGGGSSSGACQCPDYCYPFAVLDGDGEIVTRYIHFTNGVVVVNDIPCDPVAGCFCYCAGYGLRVILGTTITFDIDPVVLFPTCACTTDPIEITIPFSGSVNVPSRCIDPVDGAYEYTGAGTTVPIACVDPEGTFEVTMNVILDCRRPETDPICDESPFGLYLIIPSITIDRFGSDCTETLDPFCIPVTSIDCDTGLVSGSMDGITFFTQLTKVAL